MNDKEKLKSKFKTWIELDNDMEMYEEIKALGQEKYEALEFSRDKKAKIREIESYWVNEDDKKTIYFQAYYYEEDNTELGITVDELFSDTGEWITMKREEDRKAEEDRKQKVKEKKEKEKKEIEQGEYRLYLQLKEKFENTKNAPVV